MNILEKKKDLKSMTSSLHLYTKQKKQFKCKSSRKKLIKIVVEINVIKLKQKINRENKWNSKLILWISQKNQWISTKVNQGNKKENTYDK